MCFFVWKVVTCLTYLVECYDLWTNLQVIFRMRNILVKIPIWDLAYMFASCWIFKILLIIWVVLVYGFLVVMKTLVMANVVGSKIIPIELAKMWSNGCSVVNLTKACHMEGFGKFHMLKLVQKLI
jgi:hypothetical protein